MSISEHKEIYRLWQGKNRIQFRHFALFSSVGYIEFSCVDLGNAFMDQEIWIKNSPTASRIGGTGCVGLSLTQQKHVVVQQQE